MDIISLDLGEVLSIAEVSHSLNLVEYEGD
jgi:hypothetical protein